MLAFLWLVRRGKRFIKLLQDRVVGSNHRPDLPLLVQGAKGRQIKLAYFGYGLPNVCILWMLMTHVKAK